MASIILIRIPLPAKRGAIITWFEAMNSRASSGSPSLKMFIPEGRMASCCRPLPRVFGFASCRRPLPAICRVAEGNFSRTLGQTSEMNHFIPSAFGCQFIAPMNPILGFCGGGSGSRTALYVPVSERNTGLWRATELNHSASGSLMGIRASNCLAAFISVLLSLRERTDR